MKEITEQYEIKFGYTPSIGELYSQYSSGELNLTDDQEDELIGALEARGMM